MKRLQHIFISNSQGDTFEAIELVGTGLALYYEHNPFWKRDEYYLIHIASGSRLLGEFVSSFVSACLWIRRIKDLTDWTQPADRLKPRYDVALLVQAAQLDLPAHRWQKFEGCFSGKKGAKGEAR